MKKTVLVVEDDRAVRNLITTALEMNGYDFVAAEDGNSALSLAVSALPDMIILDLGLPDMDGNAIIKKIRGWTNNPIIVVSARIDVEDKIKALDSGADDYIVKPFSVDELLARIRAAIRKLDHAGGSHGYETKFKNGELTIDFMSGCVIAGEREVHLTPIEFKLLCMLAKNAGKVLTYNYIIQEVWPNPQGNEIPSLRVFMATLRKKIERSPDQPEQIQTHVGIGYRLVRQ